MAADTIQAFLPCRIGSERVPAKNTRPFAGVEGGLFEVKLGQILAARRIDRVIVSTNDPGIIARAGGLIDPRLSVHDRDPRLCSSETSTDDLVLHAGGLFEDGHILWTHVTSPFLNTVVYDQIVERYFLALTEGHDSLMTVTRIQEFLWDGEHPVNYDRAIEKWPRTQTLAPLYEVNSGVFLAPVQVYRSMKDRIGARPFLFETDRITGMDVDWPDDFALAEQIALAGIRPL